MVEGYVCGADGSAVSNVDVLVKDTKISYGQVVMTDGDGYYKATFHLHNDNLGDPLLVEVRGEQQHLKVDFDPKDLESERRIQVNFGTGCDANGPPVWLWWGGGAVVVAVGSAIGMKLVRSQRRQERGKGKWQSKRKS
ncbi:MAG: carboxypeptidase-like regulatory domain-containing protein [Nitrospira sp.]